MKTFINAYICYINTHTHNGRLLNIFLIKNCKKTACLLNMCIHILNIYTYAHKDSNDTQSNKRYKRY